MRIPAAFRAFVTCAFVLLSASGAFADTTPAAQGSTSQSATPASGATTPASSTATSSTPDLSIPTDTATSWQVGFTVFTADSLSPENAYLAYSLPLILRNELEGLDAHTYADSEKALARGNILQSALLTAEKALTAARAEHDAMVFKDAAPSADAVKATATKITAAVARRDFLRSLDPARITIADFKPVTFKVGDSDGSLIAAPKVPLDVFSQTQGLDLVIGGSVMEMQGYLVVDVWAYDHLRGIKVLSTRQAAQRDELYANVAGMGRELAATILGNDWSMLVFAPSPSQSSLYVDGTLVATGAAPALYIRPGSHQIRVATPGYQDSMRTVVLAPDAELRIEDALDPEAVGTIAISSDPAGASFYLDSILKGVTPLTVARPAVRDRGVLSLDGYYDKSFSLEPTSPDVLSFTLELDHGDQKTLQRQARDSFYFSFGMFALSIPIPLFSYALSNDYWIQYSDLKSQGLLARAGDAQTTSYVFLGTYYAGIAISVALFSWMVYRIINYVTVSNGTAG